MCEGKSDLGAVRLELDGVNRELRDLYLRRSKLVAAVAADKLRTGKAVFDPQREQAILESMTGGLSKEEGAALSALFSTLMITSRASQYRALYRERGLALPLPESKELPTKGARVACQGVAGAFSHQAATLAFSAGEITFYPTFSHLFVALESGEADFAVLPIENSNAGAVGEVYDLLEAHRLYIRRSFPLKVQHCLLAPVGATLDTLSDIYSHEQALSQCRDFFLEHPNICQHSYRNTAAAAQQVAEWGDPTMGAIAARECATLYPGLSVLKENLQGTMENFTRFIVLATTPGPAAGANRTSVTFSLPHRQGALHSALGMLSAFGVNLLKLENRPLHTGDFSVRFYCDLEGTVADEPICCLLSALLAEQSDLRFLGSYPDGVPQ